MLLGIPRHLVMIQLGEGRAGLVKPRGRSGASSSPLPAQVFRRLNPPELSQKSSMAHSEGEGKQGTSWGSPGS